MYELTKVLGQLDLTGLKITDELRAEFLQRGHITLDDKGDDYDPSDIVGGPLAFIGDGPVLDLYGKIFDGPDNTLIKAQRLSQALKQSRQPFAFKAILGKTADGLAPKLRVALVQSQDNRHPVKIVPTLDLESVVSSGKRVETSQDRL